MPKPIRRRVQAERLEPRRMLAVTIDFEDVGTALAAESFFNGPVPDGTQQLGPFGDTVVVGDFQSRGATFNNTHSLDFGSWSGWAYSNSTDSTTAGFLNQHSAVAGGGANGSATYGIAFGSALIEKPSSPAGLQFDSLMVTNNTYAALSMRDGDSFAKQFGGPTGDDPDYLLLTIEGLDATGAPIDTVDFYLADYRFSDNTQDYIVYSWTEVDISSLAAATTLAFSWDSTDIGTFGINTPLYAAIDDIELVDSVVVDPLTAAAGGPYAISEGESLTLNGFADGATSPFFLWDIDGDGQFGDIAGANPTLTWQQLMGFGIDDGTTAGTTFDIALRVSDGTSTVTESTTLTLTNSLPSVTITGPSTAETNATVSFQLNASDPSLADATGSFDYQVHWGDGTTERVTGNATTIVSHTYTDPRAYTIVATATDRDDGISDPITHSVVVQSIVDNGGEFTITGSSGGDRIVIFPSNAAIGVRMNSLTTTITAANRIVVDGSGGNDFIVVTNGLTIPVVLIGGEGNDYLAGSVSNDSLLGGAGNDVLLTGEGDNFADGGPGNDRLEGRSGRDVLFGGAGNDRINGGSGDDLLVGNSDNDVLFGNLGADLLAGGNGADSLQGHFGNDILLGGDHGDHLRGGSNHDLLIGGESADILRGEGDDDVLVGGTSYWEALLDAALADLQTTGTPLPSDIQLVIDSWTMGQDATPLQPFTSGSGIDALDGGSGTNMLFP